MPFVNVRMLEGRSHDQKKRLVKAITDMMADICDAKPDGTMVVIEEAEKHIGKQIAVTVTRNLQTETGRMVFAPCPMP